MKYLLVAFSFLFLSGEAAFAMRADHLRQMGKIRINKYTSVKKSGGLSLKDIAEFEGLPSAAIDYLAKVKIGESPKSGEKLYYTSYALSEIFRQPLSTVQKKHHIKVMLSVPQKVTIYNADVAFSEESVKMQIETHLEADCDDCRYEVSQLQLPIVEGVASQKGWSIEFHRGVMRGTFSLPVRFSGEDVSRLFWVNGQVRKYMRVPVINRRVGAGEKVAEADVVIQEMDVTFADDSPASIKQLEGASLRRSLAAGEIVWQKHLQRERAISFGDTTKVIVGNDGWQVSLTAIAQQNGDIGDQIKLVNPKTRNYISAKVVGPKLVKVERW